MTIEADNDRRWTRGGLVAAPRCPMCGEIEREAVGSSRDTMRNAIDEWHLWVCHTCRSVWLDPRPDDASISFAYDFDYVTHSGPSVPRRAGWVDALVNGYLNRRFGTAREPASTMGAVVLPLIRPLRQKLDYFGRHLPRPSAGQRLLDVGCGNGEFVVTAESMGWEAEGVDPDPVAVSVCRSRGLSVTEGFVSDIPMAKRCSYWDVITMSHSLEHVADPRGMLRDIHALLAPGGLLWLALPNPEAMGARLFGTDWESYDVPRHLCLPSIEALRRACCDAGFVDVSFPERGAHTRRLYRRSAEIARERGHAGLRSSMIFSSFMALLVDTYASFSSRRADECVLLARRRA